MSRIDDVLLQIESAYEARKKGTYLAIPFPLPKLNKVVPGIIPGLHYLITAGTKVGKSKITRQLFVMNTYNWAKKNNYKVKIFYFPLEDGVDKVYKIMLCNLLYVKYGLEFTPEQINGYSEDNVLNEELIERLRLCKDEIKGMEDSLLIQDTAKSGRALFNIVKDELLKHGEIEYEEFTNEKGEMFRRPKRYTNKTGTHFIVVLDNMQNLQKEDDQNNEMETLSYWMRVLVREFLCTFFNCTVVNIQQQASGNEAQQFTNTGNLIWEKLVPSIPGLGNFKAAAQTAHVVMGFFSPYRFNIANCPGIPYNLGKLKDNYRLVRIIASNIGESPVDLHTFFDGLTEAFGELPKNGTKECEDMYEFVSDMEKRRGLMGNTSGEMFNAFSEFM